MSKIAPSILAADPLKFGDAVRTIAQTGCDAVHFDVMDGVFVPNLTFGPGVLKAMSAQTPADYDVHLMMIDPLRLIDSFAESGATGITVHEEADHFEESLTKIRQLGLRVGASLKPATPADVLRPYLDSLDLVLVMTVEPGFGGQKFMPDMMYKISALRSMGFNGIIEVDGGVSLDNAEMLAKAGVDMMVMGTAFFRSEDQAALVEKIHSFGA